MSSAPVDREPEATPAPPRARLCSPAEWIEQRVINKVTGGNRGKEQRAMETTTSVASAGGEGWAKVREQARLSTIQEAARCLESLHEDLVSIRNEMEPLCDSVLVQQALSHLATRAVSIQSSLRQWLESAAKENP